MLPKDSYSDLQRDVKVKRDKFEKSLCIKKDTIYLEDIELLRLCYLISCPKNYINEKLTW